MNNTGPCKDCPDRHYKCHMTCDDYIGWSNQIEKERTERQEYIHRDNFLNQIGKKKRKA